MRLLDKAGLKGKGLVLHSLRHAYATELSKSGLPVKEIARRMAHMSEATTLRYIHTLMYE
jgi:integrase